MEEPEEYFKNFRGMLKDLPLNPSEKALRYIGYGYNMESFAEYYSAQLFYSCYLRGQKKEVVLENVEYLQTEREKVWWNFFIDRSDDLVKTANEDFFDTVLNEFAPAHIDRNFLLDIFEPHMPFFTDVDNLEFGIKNLENSKFKYFYILLSSLLDDYLPYKNDTRDFKEDWEEGLLEELQRLVKKFVKLAPHEKKELALMRIFDAFKQINASDYFGAKIPLSYRKVLYDESYPLNGRIFIPWDKVNFFDGFYFVYHPSFPNGEAGKTPYRVDDPASRKAYNDLQTYFKKRLLPIYADCRGGIIKKILNPQRLTECILLMESKTLAPTRVSKKTSMPTKKKKREISKRDALNLIKEYKSRFLDYLCSRQLEDYSVICCIESKINSNLQVAMEYSFIFTIKETPTTLTLAFENAEDARCTYLFTIPKRDWAVACDIIYEFFASNEVNKRESMARRLVDLKLPGNRDYARIMHSDYYNWTQRIKMG